MVNIIANSTERQFSRETDIVINFSVIFIIRTSRLEFSLYKQYELFYVMCR